jgi:hypothetical protein
VNEKLEQLAEQSTAEVEKNQRKFFWQADGYKFNNVNLARWYEKENNCWVEYVDRQLPIIKQSLSTQSFDPNRNYNLEFIKTLKQTYKKVNLLFSGGYDSTQIFYDFVENGLTIDETIVNIGIDIEPEITKEILLNVNPLLEKYRSHVKKQTVIQYSYEQINQRWMDDWALFDRPYADTMPPVATNIGIGNVIETDPDACYIKGVDKPQLVRHKDKWYVVALDQNLGTHYEIPTLIYFWLDANNVMSLVKDARLYRDWLVESNKVADGLQFFYMWDNDQNQFLGRRKIPRPDVKLSKSKKMEIRHTRLIEQQKFTTMSHYCNSLKKFQEIFPETIKDGFGPYTNKSKFAWFIDIDSLIAYTQQELIPDGF